MTPEQQAAEARQLLEHPRLVRAFTNIRENIVSQLEYTPIGNETARTELVISLQMLKAIQQDIENDIHDVNMNNDSELRIV